MRPSRTQGVPVGHTAGVTITIEPPNSVVLIVGREQFTVPSSFGGAASVGTKDCVALGVRSVDDGPTTIKVVDAAPATAGLALLGEYELESEGLLSVRDVYSRELLAVGVEPGICSIAIWGNHAAEPDAVTVVVRGS